jgi:hypothetical protein
MQCLSDDERHFGTFLSDLALFVVGPRLFPRLARAFVALYPQIAELMC